NLDRFNMNKVKKEFMSLASLQACFYIFLILLFLTPVAYIYDYNGFYLAELRSFFFGLATFYTFAVVTYVEIKRIKQPTHIIFPLFIILISYLFLLLLVLLFAWSVIDYNNGNLKLERVYDPVLELFF